MIRLSIINQRGGATKTTTTSVLARCFSDRGMRVLVIDADPQGSLAVILGLSPRAFLSDLLIEKLAFRECVVSAKPGLDIICGNRLTTDAETKTIGLPGSEFLFRHLLVDYEKNYDVVLIDVAPSISLFQTCAMVYTQHVLVPVDMDILSVQGATSTIHACETLNRMLEHGLNIRPLGILPCEAESEAGDHGASSKYAFIHFRTSRDPDFHSDPHGPSCCTCGCRSAVPCRL